jgi:hypothetical protein
VDEEELEARYTREDFAELRARERRDARAAAKAFAAACEIGDVHGFWVAVDRIFHETVDGLRLAMMKVARLPAVPPQIQEAFLELWIESKHIP